MTLKMQIALEFMILFAFIIVIFLFMFALIATQRGSISNQQTYSQLQVIAQNIAQQINFAEISGTGYIYNSSLYSTIGVPIYNISITKTGIVVVNSKINTQVISGIAYANSNNIEAPSYLSNNTIFIQNYLGQICIDQPCYQINNIPSKISTYSSQSSLNGKSGYTINAVVLNTSGLYSFNSLIGFSTTLGNFSEYAFSTNRTNKYGTANVFISRNGPGGTAIAKAIGFEGGQGMIENLSQWFPLNLDSGNYIYDLSGYNAIATLVNVSWAEPNYAATFQGNSYIKIPSLTLPQSFSIGIWVYPYQNVNEELFGQNSSTTGSFSISALNSTDNNQFMLNIQGFGNVIFGSYTPDTWSFIGLSYDGATKNISTYENGVLLTSNILTQSLLTSSPFYLGYSKPNPGFSSFTGKLSNFQVYATNLLPNQITQLTNFGIQTPPIINSNSIIWMQLNGNLDNYAGNNYNLFTSGSVSFSNPEVNTNLNTNQSSILVASFNGINSAINITNPSYGLVNSGDKYPLSISTWFKLNSPQSIQQLIYTYSTSSFCGFNLYLENSNTVTFSNNCGSSFSFPQQFLDNHWYNLVLTNNVSAPYTTSIYLNGVLIQSTPFQLITSTGWTKLSIGNSPGNYLNGELSNIQLYNTTLSPSSVAKIFQNGEASIPNDNNLTVWLPLDGNTNDYSFNGSTTSSNIEYNQKLSQINLNSYSLNGYGLLFNGNGAASSSFSNTVVGTNSFTINDWIYPYPTSHVLSFVSMYYSSSAAFGLTLNKQSSSTGLVLNLSLSTGGNLYNDIGGKIPFYTWTQVTGVYNGKNLTSYINGQEASVLNGVTPTLANEVTSFNFGGVYINNYPYDYNGIIADESLFKSALNATQIYMLYKLGMPITSTQKLPIS
jgi:hypothetical protein